MEPSPPKPESVAVLMCAASLLNGLPLHSSYIATRYTSGSTGTPKVSAVNVVKGFLGNASRIRKGVVLRHSQLVAFVGSCVALSCSMVVESEKVRGAEMEKVFPTARHRIQAAAA